MSNRSSWFLVLLIIAAFFVGIRFDERYSKILIKAQMFSNSEEDFSVHVIGTPFHRWSGYVYMYPVIQEVDAEGYWRNTEEVTDDMLQSGQTFFGMVSNEEGRDISYVIVCSPTPITTIAEAEALRSTDKTNLAQSEWFSVEPGWEPKFTLTCDK